MPGNSSKGKASSTQYLVMMGATLRLHERAHLFHNRQLVGRQSLREFVKVTIRRGQLLWFFNRAFGY